MVSLDPEIYQVYSGKSFELNHDICHNLDLYTSMFLVNVFGLTTLHPCPPILFVAWEKLQ
jgi:hypothetical protein